MNGSISSRCAAAENPSKRPVQLLQTRASWGGVGKAANTPSTKRVCTCNSRAYCPLVNETEGDDALSINWSLVPAYANCKSDLHAMIRFDGDELVLRVNIGLCPVVLTQSHVANQASLTSTARTRLIDFIHTETVVKDVRSTLQSYVGVDRTSLTITRTGKYEKCRHSPVAGIPRPLTSMENCNTRIEPPRARIPLQSGRITVWKDRGEALSGAGPASLSGKAGCSLTSSLSHCTPYTPGRLPIAPRMRCVRHHVPAPLHVIKRLRVCFTAGCVVTGDKWPPTIGLGLDLLVWGFPKSLEFH